MKLSNLVPEIIFEMSKKKLPDKGDCFDAAFEFMFKNSFTKDIPNLKLVHGFVSGQGELSGYRYTHAWCEDDENVYDYSNGRTLKIPKIIYYSIGNINPDQGKYYTNTEFRKMVNLHSTKGPWEIENKAYKQKYNPETRSYD